MFEQSARYYDVIYRSFKDYEEETARIRTYIEDKHPECRSVLDVACGTGEHDKYLKRHFRLDGVDLDGGMLTIARDKNPECRYHQADMTDFHLGAKYDVVMCLFSSIAYVQTWENVVKALRQFANHLNDDGVILVEPWFTPEAVRDGYVSTLTAEGDGIKICRMSHMRKLDRMSVLTFEYLIGSGSGVEHLQEEHRLALFTVEEMTRAFGDAGLDIEYDPDGISGRGMYLARKHGSEGDS